MDELTHTFVERGDLAHLALFLWASGASGLYLALIINEAREEATDRLRDNVPAQVGPLPNPTLGT